MNAVRSKYSQRDSCWKYGGDGASRVVSASASWSWNLTASAPHSAATSAIRIALPRLPSWFIPASAMTKTALTGAMLASPVKDYVKDYFDRHAHGWVEAAYAGDVRFPVGPERVRLAIEGVAPAMREGSRLVDLGCGGGQLCVHAAHLGWRAVGVDDAPGMIEEARANAGELAIEWIVGAVRRVGAAGRRVRRRDGDRADRVPARRRRALRRGGAAPAPRRPLRRLVPEPPLQPAERERLHGAGARRGSARGCSTSCATASRAEPDELHALAESLAASADELERAAAADREEPPPELHDHRRAFQRGRRQHTPRDLAPAAERHGFREAETLALHPHPLPPALEPLAPRTYNRLALAWQRPLERSPAGLAFCTAFVAVFERA